MDEQIRIASDLWQHTQGTFLRQGGGVGGGTDSGSGNYTVDVIDPAVVLPQPGQEGGGHQGSANLWQRMAAADAFVVVTPEYNHGYPAALKSLIDSVGAEWQAKPVAFVSYGGDFGRPAGGGTVAAGVCGVARGDDSRFGQLRRGVGAVRRCRDAAPAGAGGQIDGNGAGAIALVGGGTAQCARFHAVRAGALSC